MLWGHAASPTLPALVPALRSDLNYGVRVELTLGARVAVAASRPAAHRPTVPGGLLGVRRQLEEARHLEARAEAAAIGGVEVDVDVARRVARPPHLGTGRPPIQHRRDSARGADEAAQRLERSAPALLAPPLELDGVAEVHGQDARPAGAHRDAAPAHARLPACAGAAKADHAP
eukprot:CAMPEP_0202775166 /NCGR_PEP_ID=MMETSP1388-20130828/47881_1 /ASSEMBLY_ACC=CAM_ASM_000864 /TAXON_ID=37098 /ORGANISM="Isochrysis sp, Strain CCMP1244" /LENGTH=173 /DNA_ID=CAMNT_0049444269 /DNA_START=177 /DNA_END=695 /DNA_ORIENTATION=+